MKKQTYDTEKMNIDVHLLIGIGYSFFIRRWTFDVRRSSFNMFDVHLSKQFRFGFAAAALRTVRIYGATLGHAL